MAGSVGTEASKRGSQAVRVKVQVSTVSRICFIGSLFGSLLQFAT